MKTTQKDVHEENKTLESKVSTLSSHVDALNQLNASLTAENEKLSKALAFAQKAAQHSRYELLKSVSYDKQGKRYCNLYIAVSPKDGKGDFAPIQIQLTKFNIGQKNLLLALAKPCEIRRVTLVADLDNRSVTKKEVVEGKPEVTVDDLPF